ncbi:hypothetical protein [Hydrogeniiclostridium mannosilyticum]|uniref:hypothetical protein n=1 Tax=Hydrogeniiclostridium mannosilyticum TaxID=2764322 RepID=UPI0018AA1EAC|nr:hypothetical protein [Hydrogeniiclostridium mannosilyticum]
MSTPFLSVFMRVCGIFRAQKQKQFSIDAFSIKWKNKGLSQADAGLPPDFQAGGPVFLFVMDFIC